MKSILLLLLFLPMIGFASFPITTDIKVKERIAVPLDYDVNQKTDIENSKIEIINSPTEKNSLWKVFKWLLKWLLIIFLGIVFLLAILLIVALAIVDIN